MVDIVQIKTKGTQLKYIEKQGLKMDFDQIQNIRQRI